MAADEIHKNDVGVKFLVTVKDGSSVIDLSTATVIQLLFFKPSEAIVTKTAILNTTGTDGKMYYTSVAGDLNEEGTWSLQGYLENPAGSWHTDIVTFDVYRNLN